MRVLVFGDSITQGFWGANGGWVEAIRRHYDAISLEDLTKDSQPYVFNLGISGETSEGLLKRIENEIKAREWPGSSIISVIAIGTNDDVFEDNPDSKFKQNLERIVEIAKKESDKVLLVGSNACDEKRTTPVFWGDYHYTNAELEHAEKIIKSVAKASDVEFVGVHNQFKAAMEESIELLEDGLHPNDAGHQLISDIVLPELNKML